MNYSVNKHSDALELVLGGNFTFNDNPKFRDLLNLIQSSTAQSITLNFEKLEFIDSAALGMLLLLHDEAKKRNIGVQICSAQGQVKKMLQLSNFEQLFSIRY